MSFTLGFGLFLYPQAIFKGRCNPFHLDNCEFKHKNFTGITDNAKFEEGTQDFLFR